MNGSGPADDGASGRILGDVLPELRRAPFEVFNDANASAFADKVVETRMALARCLEGAKTPLDSGAPTPPEVDLDALLRKHAPKPEVLPHQPSLVSVLASLLLARAGTRPPQPQPQPPAAVNGTLPDPGTSLRTAMAAVAAASPQTAGMFKEKASSYRGITRRKRRWEAHVWRHGRQAYLGGYRDEVEAARAYDMAVLKIRGKEADTNFPRDNYLDELREMCASEMSVEDFIVCMRDRAKRRSKALKEEEEERRTKVIAGLVKRQANASANAANGNGLLLAKLYSLPSGPLLKSIPSHDLHQMVQAVGQLKQQQAGGRRGGEGGSVQGAGQAAGREELTSAKTQGSETANNRRALPRLL